MLAEQKTKCHAIIHAHAVAAAAGNLVPIPGVGVAVDMAAISAMMVALCEVLGGDVSREVRNAVALTSIKEVMLKHLAKTTSVMIFKCIPGVNVIAAGLSIGLLEAAGWRAANRLDKLIHG